MLWNLDFWFKTVIIVNNFCNGYMYIAYILEKHISVFISDLLLIQGVEILLKVALVLLGNHKELILQCDSFETIVEFIKTTLPEMGVIQMERVINQVSIVSLDLLYNIYTYTLFLKHKKIWCNGIKKSILWQNHYI